MTNEETVALREKILKTPGGKQFAHDRNHHGIVDMLNADRLAREVLNRDVSVEDVQAALAEPEEEDKPEHEPTKAEAKAEAKVERDAKAEAEAEAKSKKHGKGQ